MTPFHNHAYKKHQVIIDAQDFGEGQEHHTLQPILESVEQRYRRLMIRKRNTVSVIRRVKKKAHKMISASEFNFVETSMTCVCPAGQHLSFRHEGEDKLGNHKAFFEGKLLQCRHCDIKHRCMKNPESADHPKAMVNKCRF